MGSKQKHLLREKKTVEAMISIYCHQKHKPQKGLCPRCQELADYCNKRVQACPFGKEKPTCQNCPIHCYQVEKKQKVIEVMRFSGPKMLLRHPVLTFYHLKDGLDKKKTAKKEKRSE